MNNAIIIGSPNSGKSLLFNRLTGLNHKVANFPGITVNVSMGKSVFNPDWQIADYPGTYSLHAICAEEQVAVDTFVNALKNASLRCVVCVLDATRLAKSLAFVLQAIAACRQANKPVVVAANMIDTLQHHKLTLDTDGLANALGVPVIGVSARTQYGITQLHQAMETATLPTAEVKTNDSNTQDALIASDADRLSSHARELAKQFGPKGDLLISTQNRLDRFFLHSFSGGISFFLIMYLLLQSIFTWAAPLMDAVEAVLTTMATWLLPVLPEGIVHHFVEDALFGGVGAFLVFVPQIFILTLIISVLEDSGYLSRAAVICHKPLQFFGLTGKSFIPMLSGFACAIPGIYAARTVDSPTKRWLTYMAIPLMPCSARLPVYGLLIAAFIPASDAVGGLFGWQGLAMSGIYLFGVLTALLVTATVSTVQSHTDDLPFVLEMPPYRLPAWRPMLRNAWHRSKDFVVKAGPIIFYFSIFIWVLGYFPTGGQDLSQSWLGLFGQSIEPIFAPLGLDWKYGIAILSSFVAREVFVGTLGTLFGIESAEENVLSLASHIQQSHPEPGAGIALLVFFAMAMQCISTLAILKKETGGWRLPAQIFVAYSILAYTAAWLAYQLTQWVIS